MGLFFIKCNVGLPAKYIFKEDGFVPKKKQKNGYYFEARIKVREGERAVYKGKVKFVWRSKQTNGPVKLTTRSRRNNPAGYILAETYVEGRCPHRFVICIVRKTQDVLDKSIAFCFPLERRQTHSSAIGRWQSSGTEASDWTALLSRKLK